MPELELTRTREDRKLYALDGVGTVRLQGWSANRATIESAGRTWRVERRGLFSPVTEALDADGGVVGEYHGKAFGRSGSVRWTGRDLTLRAASRWRSKYALADGERELAVFDGKGWGKRPVSIVIDDPSAISGGLILFVAFVVRNLAENANTAAGGGAVAASVAATG
jgi:hypothetical protein